jgi:type IV secretion system protein VirB9
VAALACLAAPEAARAAAAPKPGVVDPRIRTIAYDPDQVVLLTGYLGFQTLIAFDPGERIENVSIGDALGWQVTPNHKANVLFLKPMAVVPATNMTVVTDRRQYAFELRARRLAGADPASLAYVVRFAYPPAPAPAVATVTPPPPQPPQKKNIAYTYTGSRVSLPSQVFDDGRFTYFQWPTNTPIPALFLVGPDGSESIVNYSVRDGYQVVEQLAPRFKLRNGAEVTLIINDGWREPQPGPLAPRPHDAKTARAAARAEGTP